MTVASWARKLAAPTWKVTDYLGARGGHDLDDAVLRKIIRLSGVTADPQEIKSDLLHQLQFVEVLQSVDVDGVEPLSRLVAPVTCPEPQQVVEPQDPPAWQPTKLAAKKQNDFYVVKKQLGA